MYPLRKRLRDLRQKGEVPPDEAVVRWAGQIVDGIGYIYSKDVLQADIGCHNLLLDKNGDLKLCDFGGSQLTGKSPQSAMRDGVDIRLFKVPVLPRKYLL